MHRAADDAGRLALAAVAVIQDLRLPLDTVRWAPVYLVAQKPFLVTTSPNIIRRFS